MHYNVSSYPSLWKCGLGRNSARNKFQNNYWVEYIINSIIVKNIIISQIFSKCIAIRKNKHSKIPLLRFLDLNLFMPRTRKKDTIWAQFIFFIDAVSSRRWRKEHLTLTFIVRHNKAPKANNIKQILNSSPQSFSCNIWFSNINNGNFHFLSQYMLYKSIHLLVHLSISTSTPLAFKPK